MGVPGGKRGNVQTGGGDRVRTISQPGCSTSVVLATGPTKREEETATGRAVGSGSVESHMQQREHMKQYDLYVTFTFICKPLNFGGCLKISVHTLLVLRSKYVSYHSGCRALTNMANVNSRSQPETLQVPSEAWRNLQHSEQRL